MYKSPLAIGLIVVALALLTAGLAAWRFVSIKSTGIPHGSALRLPHHIGLIIVTTERYLPTLHRNPDKDRYRLDLLVVPLDEPTRQETFTLQRQQRRNATQPMTKILGADGDVVWVQALDIFAVNLKTKRILRLADLRKLNPELELFFNTARFEFTDRLIAVAPDRQLAYAINATTFKAEPAPTPKTTGWVNPHAAPEMMLCSGGLISSNEWFGVLAAKELASSFKPGFSLPREFPVNDSAKELRQLYRGRIDPATSRPRILAMESVPGTNYQNAAMVRSATGTNLLRLAAPDSVLLTHLSSLLADRTVILTRLDLEGQTIWTMDTGVGRLEQVLPDERIIAFIGTRPAIPNKVPEPILVLLHTDTGAIQTTSLWR